MDETQPIDPEVKKFWEEIVYKDGVMQEDLVLLELADLQTLAEEVGKVYERVTGGLVSKPTTKAETVISLFEDQHYNKSITQDDIRALLEDSKLMTKTAFIKSIKEYFDIVEEAEDPNKVAGTGA